MKPRSDVIDRIHEHLYLMQGNSKLRLEDPIPAISWREDQQAYEMDMSCLGALVGHHRTIAA